MEFYSIKSMLDTLLYSMVGNMIVTPYEVIYVKKYSSYPKITFSTDSTVELQAEMLVCLTSDSELIYFDTYSLDIHGSEIIELTKKNITLLLVDPNPAIRTVANEWYKENKTNVE